MPKCKNVMVNKKNTMNDNKDIWVFGYGSLMWSPGFEFEEIQLAELKGYHRDLCILSYVFRGTPEIPGLVMGLNPGGTCVGRAIRVSAKNKTKTIQYLHEREMINNVYEPCWRDIILEDGQTVSAYVFVAVKDHGQYVGHFSTNDKVKYVLQGHGQGGSSLEYLENTCTHLRELNIQDDTLEAILQRSHAKMA